MEIIQVQLEKYPFGSATDFELPGRISSKYQFMSHRNSMRERDLHFVKQIFVLLVASAAFEQHIQLRDHGVLKLPDDVTYSLLSKRHKASGAGWGCMLTSEKCPLISLV